MRTIIVIFFAAIFLSASCSTKMIKGTDIPDNEDNRAVLAVFGQYVKAIMDKSPEGVLKVVSPNYYDNNGTDAAKDDVDYKALEAFLKSDDFSKILKVEAFFTFNALKVNDDKDVAKLLYYYELRFKKANKTEAEEKSLLNLTNEKWLKVNDNNLMTFKKENGEWKIFSGL